MDISQKKTQFAVKQIEILRMNNNMKLAFAVWNIVSFKLWRISHYCYFRVAFFFKKEKYPTNEYHFVCRLCSIEIYNVHHFKNSFPWKIALNWILHETAHSNVFRFFVVKSWRRTQTHTHTSCKHWKAKFCKMSLSFECDRIERWIDVGEFK